MGTDPPALACKLKGGEARSQTFPFKSPASPGVPIRALTQVNIELPAKEDRIAAFKFPPEERILRRVPSFAAAPSRGMQGIWRSTENGK